MKDHDETARIEDPQSLTNQLRCELLGLDEDSEQLPNEPTDNERWGDRFLSDTALTYPAAVTAAADSLIPLREPSLEARAKMIEAANRALRERRKMNGLLPVLLRTAREQLGLTPADAAASSALPEESIRALEWGENPVDIRLPVDMTVAWIRA